MVYQSESIKYSCRRPHASRRTTNCCWEDWRRHFKRNKWLARKVEKETTSVKWTLLGKSEMLTQRPWTAGLKEWENWLRATLQEMYDMYGMRTKQAASRRRCLRNRSFKRENDAYVAWEECEPRNNRCILCERRGRESWPRGSSRLPRSLPNHTLAAPSTLTMRRRGWELRSW